CVRSTPDSPAEVRDPSSKMSSVRDRLRSGGILCDAVLKVQDAEFPVHKVIMCSCSEYFRALFIRWSKADQRVFDITGTTPAILEAIIKFSYTGSVSVTEDNVKDLMIKADEFNITHIIQVCSRFLEDRLGPDTCIRMWHFSEIYYFTELRFKAYCYILDHFQDVVSTEDFLQLTALELGDLIVRDELNVSRESTVYEAIMKWIRSMLTQRGRHLHSLMSKIRLGLMSTEYTMMNMLSNDLVANDSQCLALVRKASRVQQFLQTHQADIGFRNRLARPRLPAVVLLVAGGWNRAGPTNSMEAYDYQVDRWVDVTDSAEHPRAYHGTAFLHGFLYYIGGFDRVQYFSSVRRFDPDTYVWQEMAPMYSRRCYVSVAVLNGLIYALGGHDGRRRLNSAECYQPQSNQWNRIAPMHDHRSDANCAVLHDKIYICGGFNGSDCLQTAEFYDPQTDQWTRIPDMSSRRSGVGVVTWGNLIYAVGGCDGENRLRSGDVYNLETNSWSAIPPMRTGRSNFGIAVLDNRIFAVGGYDGNGVTGAVESYDRTLNQWSEACDLLIPRSALSCCVVDRFPNMHQYILDRDSLPLKHESFDSPALIN
uniref:Kelch-like protein 10 n=1 Tax=Salarias fasciatus TaxID=181472 RepID=A0A672GEB7_SALFA